MDPIALPARTLEVTGNTMRQSAMIVGDHKHHVRKTARLKPAECFFPCRKDLPVTDPDAKKLKDAVIPNT